MNITILRKRINILLIVLTVGSWLALVFFSAGPLAQTGLRSLKYFTVQSNLLVGAASAVWLRSLSRDGEPSIGAERFKYVAAAAVGLTCVTVLVFLGPLYGYPAMFVGGNFFLHLVNPVLSIYEMLFLSDAEFTRRDNRLVIIPPIVYGIVYLGNNLINGIGEWPDTNDWYLFLTWGYPVGIFIFAVICVVTWLLGLAMRKVHSGVRPHKK